MNKLHRFAPLILLLLGTQNSLAETKPAVLSPLASQLALAGDNRSEIERALADVPATQKASMQFLIENMPQKDLETLSAKLLLDNVRLAHQARETSPWKISDELFLNDVLPYANVDETRESWRENLRKRALRISADCKTPGEAAQRLNEKLFKEVGVRYSTKRKRANQSPSESIDQGLASCTGLSILLVDACRSVNVPARLVGVPSWTTKRGNHTSVEVWDDGWHFTGAAEYNAAGLNKAWFVGDASKADKSSRMHSIYAVSFRKTETTFPLVWSREGPRAFAVNVTDRYARAKPNLFDDQIEVRVQVRSKATGERIKVPVRVCLAEETSEQCAFGESRGESDDTNNMLTFKLKQNKRYKLSIPNRLDEYFLQTEKAKTQTVSIEVDEAEEVENESADSLAKVDDGDNTLSKAEAAALAKRIYAQRLDE